VRYRIFRAHGKLELRAAGVISLVSALIAVALGCATLPGAPRPEVRAVDARISGVDLGGVSMVFDVAAHNPYPVAIRTTRFRYGLEIGGADFINSDALTRIDLPAGETSTVALPVRLSYYDLWREYPTLRGSATAKYRLHAVVGFSVMGASLDIPFSHEGTFPIFRPPIVTAAKVQLADVSLSKAKIIVDSEIENPNAFALDVSGLKYELDLGDVRLAVLDPSGGETIGPGQTDRLILTGEVSASNGLIKLLMNGVSGVPQVTVSGLVRTAYGTIRLSE